MAKRCDSSSTLAINLAICEFEAKQANEKWIIKGKVDNLLGLKENVIIGKLIPAGTGMACYNTVDIVGTAAEEAPAEVEEAELTDAADTDEVGSEE